MTVYPGVDVSYRPTSRWRLHASYNTSLRMPSFTEMYYKLQGYKADPHLKPEKMSAIEFGINSRLSIVDLHLTLWHHRGKDMIDWIMDTSKGSEAEWQSVNHTAINSVGVEFGAKLSIPKFTLSIDYGYIYQDKDSEKDIVSQYALEYLRHKLVARARITLWRQLALNLTGRWQDRTGRFTDFDGQTCDYKPYALLDARLTWQQRAWKVYIEGTNLFDKSYHDFGLVEQPGRWLIVGASVSL